MSAPVPPRHHGHEPNGDHNGDGHATAQEERQPTGTDSQAVRDLVADDRAGRSRVEEARRATASTASSDAVQAVRQSLNDLKHDVRMLKVGLDKQGANIDRIVAALEEREREEE